MSTFLAKIQAGFEPIPGYVLTHKIGAGGYGEVWSADAPGGLKKAIKFVHGNIDESRASSELKSLQRIRQVNHPFILSLERIEVIQGQLLIVTELAQGSLFDRFLEYREKGFSGIARDRLINYLKDAADGLDFLCQKHDLQHLDVKPGNLLVLSDRVKVADFGLVKDLQSNTLSLMGGLTPTYAAPEMFDGRPGRYSDQYSLAIVYQEMLTGTLPFRGRTAAQLANEHLHKAPSLDELPISDRPVIAKALSKKPHQRFADCREMIAALEQSPSKQVAPEETSERFVQQRGWNPRATNSSRNTGAIRSNPQSKMGNPLRKMGRPQSVQAIDSKQNGSSKTKLSASGQRVIYIGAGGIGADALSRVRQMLTANPTADFDPRFLAIDTDSRSLEPLVDRRNEWHLDYGSVLHIPLKTSHYYRDELGNLPQLSRRWLYNIPRSQQTDGVRPLGMLATIDHALQLHDRILTVIMDLAESVPSESPMQIKLVGSCMGGTGSAILSELGFLIRQAAESLSASIDIELLLTCAAPSPSALGDLASASSIACLLEINHYFRTGGLHPALPGIPPSPTNKPPFDRVKLIYGGQLGDNADREECIRQVADYLLLPSVVTPTSTSQSPSEGETSSWLTTVCTAAFPLEQTIEPSRASTTMLVHSLMPWVYVMDNSAVDSEESPKEPTKTTDRLEFFISDLFRLCNWNAQAWVRECMKVMVPNVQNRNQNTEPLKPAGALEIDDLISTVHEICQLLGIAPEEGEQSIERLLKGCNQILVDQIGSHWLHSPSHWEQIPVLLNTIGEKLRINANSLFVVSQRLDGQQNELIEAKETASEGDSEISQTEIESRLGKLSIESKFHALSGKLLQWIAGHLETHKNIWKKCSRNLSKSLVGFGNQICQETFGNGIEKFLQSGLITKTDAMTKSCKAYLAYVIASHWHFLSSPEKPLARPPHASTIYDLLSPAQGIETQLRIVLDKLITDFEQHTASSSPQSLPNGDAPATGESMTLNKTLLQGLGFAGKTIERMTAGTITQVTNPSKRISDPFELQEKLESVQPYLADFGASLAQTLYLSEYLWFQMPEELRSKLEATCSIQTVDGKLTPTIIAEGTELDVEELIDKLWMPTSETWQLVPRVISRVDIDWIPFSTLQQET